MSAVALYADPFDRVALAMEAVKQRLRRAAEALGSAGVSYAVIGGNAVAAWVGSVDSSVVRNTVDVDILLRREDLDSAKAAMAAAGFIHRRVAILNGRGHIEMFLDGPGAKAREAVHVIVANEKVAENDPVSAPDVNEAEQVAGYRLVTLEALIRMKLVAFRDKDRMHLRDLLSVGLFDQSWIHRYPPELAAKLQTILDDPEG
ncbi:MAG: hypothetical protein JNK37_02210 [Verrucomicrobiales bacterium]|nr:hypothetical protein [Verrucomicrobiales bacterium]